eukprot:664306-Prymnesium_polylepis.1
MPPKQGKYDNTIVDDPALLPDGVLSYQFKAGQFWNSIHSNFLDGKAPALRLNDQDKQVVIDNFKWLPGWVAELKEKRAAAPADKPSVSMKVRMLVALFSERPP